MDDFRGAQRRIFVVKGARPTVAHLRARRPSGVTKGITFCGLDGDQVGHGEVAELPLCRTCARRSGVEVGEPRA